MPRSSGRREVGRLLPRGLPSRASIGSSDSVELVCAGPVLAIFELVMNNIGGVDMRVVLLLITAMKIPKSLFCRLYLAIPTLYTEDIQIPGPCQ